MIRWKLLVAYVLWMIASLGIVWMVMESFPK